MSTTQPTTDRPDPFLSEKLYDLLKFLAQIALPALGTLYFALAQIWGFPAGNEVVGSVVAVDTFLGVVLGISTQQYVTSGAKYSGVINVDNSAPDKKTYQLELNHDPEELDTKKEVVFKVQPVSPPSPSLRATLTSSLPPATPLDQTPPPGVPGIPPQQ